MLYVCAVRFDMMENMKTLQKFLELNKTLHYVQQSNYGKIVFFFCLVEKENRPNKKTQGAWTKIQMKTGGSTEPRAPHKVPIRKVCWRTQIRCPPFFFSWFLSPSPSPNPEPSSLNTPSAHPPHPPSPSAKPFLPTTPASSCNPRSLRRASIMSAYCGKYKGTFHPLLPSFPGHVGILARC